MSWGSFPVPTVSQTMPNQRCFSDLAVCGHQLPLPAGLFCILLPPHFCLVLKRPPAKLLEDGLKTCRDGSNIVCQWACKWGTWWRYTYCGCMRSIRMLFAIIVAAPSTWTEACWTTFTLLLENVAMCCSCFYHILLQYDVTYNIWAISKTLGSRKGHPQIWEGPIAYHTFVQ